jgi:galactose-1-phosphate uridylyltransferase
MQSSSSTRLVRSVDAILNKWFPRKFADKFTDIVAKLSEQPANTVF